MAVEVAGTFIRIPQGDTGPVKFTAIRGEITEKDKGVFTLAKRDGLVIMRKIMEADTQDQSFSMMFVHGDTARLKPDTYEWSFRVVQNAVFDADGRMMDTQKQHTAVISGHLSVAAVAGGAR